MRKAFLFLCAVAAGGAALAEDVLPAGVKAVWDIGRASRQATPTRESICINGLWQWQPASGGEAAPPTDNWGYFKVPGPVPGITDYMQKDSQQVYAHPRWKDTRLGGVSRMWYQREIEIPQGWQNRRIVLKADYVVSRAAVYLDGKLAGEILYPSGDLDITGACALGKKHTLSLDVTALPLAEVIALFGDTNAPKQGAATVNRRGLCGDVFLVSEPKGPRIADVRVETSVRNGEITVHALLENIDPKKSDYRLSIEILDGNKTVHLFNKPFKGDTLVNGRISVADKWKPDKLWDIHTPENSCQISACLWDDGIRSWTVDGLLIPSQIQDMAFPVRFGFREFWIDGRDLYLNGSRIWLSCVPLDNAQVGAALASYEAAKETMLRLKSFGVNFVYTHNYDCNPGSFISFAEILRAADDTGMLVSFAQPHFGHFDWSAPDADAKNGYARLAAFLAREAQNHPSVIFYSMSHNATGYTEDMNPFLMDGIAAPRSRWAENNLAKARRAEAIVRKLDPGRIVYHHASGNLGPMHISNFYGNWIPVQEMSDWFGHWATAGTKPMFTCEYGVPFTWDWAMYRGWYGGKREFGSAPAPWEFCNAEWNAQFAGDAAFDIGEPEKKNLRWEAKQFHDGKAWRRWDYPHPLGSRDFTDQDPILAAYITDNWRAFRTWGLSINSYWEHGRLWRLRPGVDKSRKNYATDWDALQRPGFSPDFQEQRNERVDLAFERDDWIPSEGAKALMRNNLPLLGYIAGKDGDFTSKDHNYLPEETVEKQFVVINNSRETQRFSDVTLETGKLHQKARRFSILKNAQPGEQVIYDKIQFSTGEAQEDTFTFHVMKPPPPIPAMSIALFDPKGETRKLLDTLRVKYRLVTNARDVNGGDIVCLGKGALDVSGNGFDVSGVTEGQRVIVFEQTAEALEKRLGFRTAQYGLRNVFRRVAGHPLLDNIADENLRDWRGASTLLPERLSYETDDNAFNGVPTVKWCGITVPRVWRCGNRGTVASVLIEKPACGDFLPILDGGFSLQYSPLMEYRHGRGMILFCQMDITGRTENDPAATHLIGNILRYAHAWKAVEKRSVHYTGNAEGRQHLEKLGVTFFNGNAISDAQRKNIVSILGPGSAGSKRLAADHTLAIGCNETALRIHFAQVAVKDAEHISTTFGPFGAGSPLRGIGPADVHNRDPKNYPLIADKDIAIGNGILGVTDGGRTVISGLAPWQFPSDKQSFKRTFRRSAFVLSRILGNMDVDLPTPLPSRFHGPVGNSEQRWLNGLYLDTPEEWDDPYRFFRW